MRTTQRLTQGQAVDLVQDSVMFCDVTDDSVMVCDVTDDSVMVCDATDENYPKPETHTRPVCRSCTK